MADRPNVELRFCVTCNARERVIERGRCIVCGNDPRLGETLPPPVRHSEMGTQISVGGKWSTADWIVFGVLGVITLYVLWQVARWPI